MDIYVGQFQAVGDGKTDDTIAIRQAIRFCSKNGGGKVIFEKNHIYRCGRLDFADNIELYLEQNAVLKAVDQLEGFSESGDIALVTRPTWENCEYSGNSMMYFLYAKNCKNIGIAGEGYIDGNEEIFYGKQTKWHIEGYFYPRVPLIFFENCKNVKIQGVTLQKSGFWTTHLVGCDMVHIHHIKILNNLRLANCDGIDPDHCKNVKIEHCYIESADDCIVFKTTEYGRKYGKCENIEVADCVLVSTSAAIKFGTESVSDFENIYVHDCKIERSNRGISFQLRDEGNIREVRMENIEIETRRFSPLYWWGKGEPIAITAVQRNTSNPIGCIENVSFRNISAICENGIFIYGEKNRNIKNIVLDTVRLDLIDKTDWEKGIYDLRPAEKYGIFHKNSSYFFITNAENIVLNKVKWIRKEEYCSFILDNVTDFRYNEED